MPRRPVHSATGCAGGVLCAAAMSSPRSEAGQLLELIGGGVGGAIGGQLPDRLEPPRTPRHRGPAHSVSAGGLVYEVMRDQLAACQDFLRRGAEEFALRGRKAAPGSLEQLAMALLQAVFYFLAGFVAGMPAGYLSHLALDAATPNGIRVL